MHRRALTHHEVHLPMSVAPGKQDTIFSHLGATKAELNDTYSDASGGRVGRLSLRAEGSLQRGTHYVTGIRQGIAALLSS